jgi:type II secretory pathway component HofQ
VPWDQALDIILKSNKLGYFVDGTIVRIAPLAVLADEEVQRRKLSDEQALAGELRVLTRPLSYAKGGDLIGILTRSALSSRGEVQVDPRTNTVIIRDLPARLTAADAADGLDLPQPVESARIVQTTRDFARNIGVRIQRPRRAGARQRRRWQLPGRQHHGRTAGPQGPDGAPNGVSPAPTRRRPRSRLLINGAVNSMSR